MGKKTITFNEYFDLLKTNFQCYNLTQQERDDYFNKSEVIEEVQYAYDNHIRKYNNNEITYEQLTIGSIGGLASNLWLEY